MFTMASDLFPRKAVGSVVGLGGSIAAFAAVGFQRLTGVILDATGSNYSIIFAYATMDHYEYLRDKESLIAEAPMLNNNLASRLSLKRRRTCARAASIGDPADAW